MRRMSRLFLAGARLTVPVVAVILRKGYGLGAMAMTAGSFARPVYTASWPTGEFGGMGLEGAVRLGFSKELEAVADPAEREALYDQLVAEAYERGKATEAASHLEIDAVIDPADTRAVLLRALAEHPGFMGFGPRDSLTKRRSRYNLKSFTHTASHDRRSSFEGGGVSPAF